MYMYKIAYFLKLLHYTYEYFYKKVFCGKIPKDMYEDELIPLFEKCGKIWDLRLMMDPMSGSNRGYAFITFTNREAAQQAVREVCHIFFFKFLLLLCSLLMMYIYDIFFFKFFFLVTNIPPWIT